MIFNHDHKKIEIITIDISKRLPDYSLTYILKMLDVTLLYICSPVYQFQSGFNKCSSYRGSDL